MFLIRWDQVRGGVVWLQYPEDLEISINAVQQIEISHNFIESYITIKESGWHSISYFNDQYEVVVVLVLSEFDDSTDYIVCIEEFNSHLKDGLDEEQLLKYLKEASTMDVFRTRDEVIAKISREWSDSQMKIHEIQAKIEDLLEMDILTVKSRIILSLIQKSEVTLKELVKNIKTSKKWTETVLKTLMKNNVVGYNSDNDTYFLSL